MREVVVSEVIAKSKFNSFFRNVFVICFLTAICEGYNINVFSLVIPSIMKDWGLGPAQIGALGAWSMGGMIFGSLFFGPLSDKIGKAKSMIIGTVIFVLFTVAVGFTQSFNQFAACRFIAGIGLAGIWPLLMAHTSEYSPKAIRGRLIVWVSSGMAIGTIVAVLTGLSVIDLNTSSSWRTMFYVAAIPVILIIAQFFLPESLNFLMVNGKKDKIAKILSEANPEFTPQPDDNYTMDAFNKTKASFGSLFQKGMAKNTCLFWIMFFINYVFTYGVLIWLPNLMIKAGFSLSSSLLFTLDWNAGFILGVPLLGWMSDKKGGKFTLIFALVMLAIFTALISVVGKNNVLLTIVLFLAGSAQHGINGVAGSYMSQNYPLSFRGFGAGWSFGIGRIGGTVGPLIGGMLLANNVPVETDFLFFASILIISIIAVSFTTDYTRNPQAIANITSNPQATIQK